MEEDYKSFVDRREEELELRFRERYPFQTTVRSIKIKGNFATKEEANDRAKKFRDDDPAHTVLVGPVGQWLIWDPDAYKTGNVNHLDKELNQLVSEQHKNEAIAKAAFDARVRETKEKAIAENKEKASKFGNSLTQDIAPDGTLVDTSTAAASQYTEDDFNQPSRCV